MINVRNMFHIFSSSSWVDKVIIICVLSFPAVDASVKHIGTLIYIALFLLGLIYGWSVRKKLTNSEKKIIFSLLVFLTVIILSIFAVDDIRSAGRKIEHYLRFLFLIPVFFLLKQSKLRLLPYFVTGCILGAFVMGIEAFIEVNILDLGLAQGGYHKIVFGDIAILLAGLSSIFVLYYYDDLYIRILGIFSIIFGVYASILSQARSSWLVIPFIMIFLAWLYRKKMTNKFKIKVTILFVLLFVLSKVWMPVTIQNGITVAISDIQKYREDPHVDTSLGARINMWRDAWTMFNSKPMLGVGVGDFQYERKLLVEKGKANDVGNYGHAHNQYLNTLAENGIVGLFFFMLAIFFYPGKHFYKNYHNSESNHEVKFWSLIGLIVLLSYFIFGIAEAWSGRNSFVNAYGFFCAVCLAELSKLNEKTN